MNKNSRMLSLLLTIPLILSFHTARASSPNYVSIVDIREEAKQGWHMTYAPNGDAIEVNIQIEVPEVTALPIICVTGVPSSAFTDFPDNAEVFRMDTGFSCIISDKPKEKGSDEPTGYPRTSKAGAQAENSPFTQDEAISFAIQKLRPYVDQAGGSFDLKLDAVSTLSRMYVVTKRTMRADTYDFSKPRSEMGLYNMSFEQVFHGIPFIKRDSLFDKPVKSEPGMAYRGFVNVQVASEKDYVIGFYPAIEDSIIAEDVPLAPFSQIMEAFERRIEQGYIRDVYRVRLGYLRLHDPANLGEKFILVPVWELNGVIVENPKSPTPPPYFDDEEEQRLNGGRTDYFNAQTGEYYDHYNNTDPDRLNAAILTWDQVK